MAAETNKSAKTMRAAIVSKAGGPLEMKDVPVPEPGPLQVRVKVDACGLCHSDFFTKEGIFPGIPYPLSPGHEVVGTVDALGAGVEQWKIGQRVGLGWYGGHCGKCEPCRRGDFVLCQQGIIPGIRYSGGYAEYLVAPAVALAAVPDGLSSADAAPLMCAGITTFNAIRNSRAKGGGLVAILGIGGLGHLAIQYAAKLGFETVAIARGADKASFAKQLGADHYIDSTSEDVGEALKKLGGAKLILSTITDAKATSAAAKGLGYAGEMVIVGVPQEPVEVTAGEMVQGRQAVQGWACGVAIDSEDTLKFSDRLKITPMLERFPLEKAPEAYDRMMSGKARFRVVLEMGK